MYKYLPNLDKFIDEGTNSIDKKLAKEYPGAIIARVIHTPRCIVFNKDEREYYNTSVEIDYRELTIDKLLSEMRKRDIRYNKELRNEFRKNKVHRLREEAVAKKKKDTEEYRYQINQVYKAINGWWIPINGKMTYRSALS